MNSFPFKPAVTVLALSALLALGACGKKMDDTATPAPMRPPSTSPSGSSSGSGTSSGSSGTAMPPTGAASGMGSDGMKPPAAAASR